MPYNTLFSMLGAGLSMLAGAPVAAVLGGMPFGGQAGEGTGGGEVTARRRR